MSRRGIRRMAAIAFHAAQVSVVYEPWGRVISWTRDARDPGNEQYLILQSKNELYTDADKRLGTDDVYIECCGQGWSWYGQIESFVLSRAAIDVQMSSSAAGHMRNDGGIHVTFEIPAEQFEELARALRETFHGRSFFADATA
jgi:immunity protein 10 of polymorphic toxin system